MKLEKINVYLKKETMLESVKHIKSQEDIINFIIEKEDINKKSEMELWLIVLNVKNQVLGYSQLSKGTTTQANVDLKDIFKRVLLLNGSKIIILKNNPSGSDDFSSYDKNFKNELEKACDIMHVQLLDFILSERKYISIR